MPSDMPTTSTDLLLCDALCEVISTEFTSLHPRRVHLPDWSRSTDLKTLRIEINPGSQPAEMNESEQDGLFVEWPVMISIAVTISRGTTATLDALLDQVDAIRQLMQEQQLELPNGASVHCQSFEYVTRIDPDLLVRETVNGADLYGGCFLSVLQFPFREVT